MYRASVLVALVALAYAAVAAGVGMDELAPTTVCQLGSKTQMLCQHNYVRGHNGQQPLYADSQLYVAAKAKLDRIIQCREFSHTPCGDTFQCPTGYVTCGENIAYGYQTVRGTMAAWLTSPGHRGNILSPLRHYGSAFSKDGGNYCHFCWVTVFAS